jgi:DNA-binding NtrC family response regulator
MNINENLNIFIANTDSHVRAQYCKYLHVHGFNNIQLYDNRKSCMSQLTTKPDIIFIDNNIIQVYETGKLKKIKDQYPGVFIVFVANHSNMQYAFHALADHTFDYVINGGGEGIMTSAIMHVLEIVSEKSHTTNGVASYKWMKKYNLQKKLTSLFSHLRLQWKSENYFSMS